MATPIDAMIAIATNNHVEERPPDDVDEPPPLEVTVSVVVSTAVCPAVPFTKTAIVNFPVAVEVQEKNQV